MVPQEIPPVGWWDVAVRVKGDIARDNVSLMSAGLSMWALLSVFPALTAAVSIYGLFETPAGVVQHLSTLSGILPPGVWQLFETQLQDVATRAGGSLTLAALVSLLIALWSARSGMSSLMTATNIAYREHEKRGLIRQFGLSLLFTIGAVVGLLVFLGLALVVPFALEILGTGGRVHMMAEVLRWFLLWGFAVLALAILYRFAPAREQARWHWVSWGSMIAATLWLAGSALFAFYVHTFASYQKIYGALGSVIVLLLWFYLSSFFVVLGAEINAELERQTKTDTTTGLPEPLGQRGAYAADTVGPTAEKALQRQRSGSERSAHTV
jgi:membrane protein